MTQDYLSDDQIKKTTERWELADNLGSHEGVRKWMPGTRYHFADTYGVVIDRKSLKPRIYPATEDGTLTGKPVFLSNERWDQLKNDQRFSSTSTEQISPIPPDLSPVSIRLALLAVRLHVLSESRMSAFAGSGHAVGKAMCEKCMLGRRAPFEDDGAFVGMVFCTCQCIRILGNYGILGRERDGITRP